MCTPSGRGDLSLQPNFQKGGGLTGKRGRLFLGGGCNFHIKDKLKSKIFNDKKSL